MKTKFTLILIGLFVLVGCNSGNSREEVLLSKYETAYKELVSNTKFEDNSEYYKFEVITIPLEDGTYRVDFIMDEPNVAMYNVQMLMELDSTGQEQYDSMNASLGIVDDTQYSLIPNQVKEEHGFYAGLILSSISQQEQGTLRIMISWSNYANTKQFVEFIEIPYLTENIKLENKSVSKDGDDPFFDEEIEEENSDE